MPAELDDTADDIAALADEQQRREQAEEASGDETTTGAGAVASSKSTSRAAPKTTRRSTNNPRDQPLTPKFAPARPVTQPDASPFPRPQSFPSESWPAPPLALLQDPQKRPGVATEMAKQPGGAPDRFARWIVSTTVAHYEGAYVNGLFDGQGTGVFKCGQKYTGQWSQGLMHGEGTLTLTDGCTYTGSMLHQAVTGRGKLQWPDGSCYDGEVLDGLRHGQGVFIDPSQPCMYEGQWSHGLRHGQGKLTYDNAGTHYYEGQWHEGARHGYGILRYASGNLYEGEWVWDRKVGQGTMSWFSSNQKYTGAWLNDKPHGVGEYTWLDLPVAGLAGQAQTTSLTARGTSVTASGPRGGGPLLTHFQHHNRYVGDWVQGVREGSGSFFFSNGSLYQGEWHNDRKEGQGRFVFSNGSVYEGEFHNDQMADASKWNNPYSGVAEQMGALSLSSGAAANGTASIASPKAVTSKKQLTPSATTVKDVGMFDLPLDDLLASHVDELGLRSSAPATQAYVTSQKEQLANLLLRYNTELLDVYRFYAQATVDLAQPAWEPAALPFTPLSPTSAPANLVHPSAQASAVSSRLNLAQLWLLISDLGIMGHPGLCTPDLSLAAIDRLVFRRMLLGRAPEAHANRLLLPDLNSIHDPRQILLVRDFNEALIRLADELFRMPVDAAAETGAAASEEEQELAREEAELARQIEQDEAAASGTPLDDSASAEYVPPTVLYARAHQSFNQLLLGPAAAPAASDLSLPLHALTALSSPTSDRSGGASQRGAITMNASSALVATGTARGGYGSTIAFAGALPAAAAVAPRNTIVNRFKRFLVEFLLPRAQRRSKHAFSSHGGSQIASPGRGGANLEPGSFGGNALGLSLTQQPLYRLPMLVQMAKQYEKDIYNRIFVPYSALQPNLLAAAAGVVSSSSASADPALKLLQPLSDRTIRLSAVLRLLQSGSPSVLNAYFTFYHCLDLLFGCQSHRDERLWEGMEVELLFEELVELLIKLGLWRGKVLATAAVSIGQERAQLERIRAERREKAEAEAKAKADAAAAAQAEIDAAAAAAAAAAEPDSKGKPGAKAAGAKAAPSKPSSATSKDKAATAGGAAGAKDAKSGAAAARAGSAKKTSSGSATPAGGKASAAPTPRSSAGSGKKKDASVKSGSKPSSAKGSKKKRSSSGSVGAAFGSSPTSPSHANGGGSNVMSPYASQPNSSRLQAALLGGASGTLRKSSVTHQSSGDVISEFDRLNLADGGSASFGGIECDTSGWAGDVEHFLCTLLQKPLPAAGVHTSFPTNLSEDGMQSVL